MVRKYLSLALMLAAIGIAVQPVQAQEYTSQNLFYLVGSLRSYESFVAHADEISIVCPAAYHIDQYGVLSGFVDPRVLKISAEKGIKVMPLFALFDQAEIHELLNNATARAEAIRLMLFYGRQFKYYGWQFDIENIHVRDRDGYTSFYEQSADSLHKYGFKISMAVVKSDQPAPESGNPVFQRYRYENSRGAFDIPAIAKAGDFISFMTYDQHTGLTPPGPVAGMPWLRGMLDYLIKLGIPTDKISLGIPNYSDYWYPTWEEGKGGHSTRSEISYEEARDLLSEFGAKEEWMSDQEVSYAHWEEGGVFNWLFLEDARSFAPKLSLAKEHKVLGISVWLLGMEDPGIWDILGKEVKTARIK
jgi:spore germination protein YaaH